MSVTTPARILDYVNGQEHVLTGLIRDLVEAESPSSQPETHDEIRRILRLALASVGYDSREVGGSQQARHIFARPIERRRGSPYQVVIGHFDTVWPVGTVAERPFRIEGNIIHGPGSFDMKGGLAQLVVALRTIRDLRLDTPVEPAVFVNGDEEVGSRSSTRYIRALARRADRAYVLEPALGEHGDIKTSRKGVGRFTVTVFGKAAHAGLDPQGGASAILELAHVIQKLFALNDVERGITVNVGTIDGGIQPNVIAPHSKAVVDVRVPTVAAGNEIEYIIHSLVPMNPDVRLHVEGGIGRPSMELTTRNQKLWEQVRRAGDDLGMALGHTRAGGGSDGNTTSQFTATVDGLGPVGDGAHAVHEHLLVDKTLERAALLVMLLTAPASRSATDRNVP